jgi:glycosyltransferase involved in cell wall biosynthesis
VLTHHGRDYERGKWGRFSKWLLRKGEKVGLRYAQEVVCIDRVTFNCLNLDSLDSRIEQPIGATKTSITFIPNGIEIPERKNDALGDYVFALGRFVPEKSFGTLVAAKPSDVRLVIAGSGPSHPPESEGVEYPGFITGKQKEELFLHCRLFVIPSLHEGLPFTLLEAMAYGCEILASDIPAHKAVGLAEDCYFVAGDANDLKQKLIYKLTNKNSNINYDAVLKSEYDWNVIAEKTMEVYKQ